VHRLNDIVYCPLAKFSESNVGVMQLVNKKRGQLGIEEKERIRMVGGIFGAFLKVANKMVGALDKLETLISILGGLRGSMNPDDMGADGL
jgi:hypothetical protein